MRCGTGSAKWWRSARHTGPSFKRSGPHSTSSFSAALPRREGRASRPARSLTRNRSVTSLPLTGFRERSPSSQRRERTSSASPSSDMHPTSRELNASSCTPLPVTTGAGGREIAAHVLHQLLQSPEQPLIVEGQRLKVEVARVKASSSHAALGLDLSVGGAERVGMLSTTLPCGTSRWFLSRVPRSEPGGHFIDNEGMCRVGKGSLVGCPGRLVVPVPVVSGDSSCRYLCNYGKGAVAFFVFKGVGADYVQRGSLCT